MMIFQAPASGIQTTTVLPSPQFDDSEGSGISVSRKRSMSNKLYTYVKVTPRQVLVYKLQLFRPKALELQSFIDTYYNTQIYITDYKNQLWLATFMDDPAFNFVHLARGEYSEVTLKFEGTLVAEAQPASAFDGVWFNWSSEFQNVP